MTEPVRNIVTSQAEGLKRHAPSWIAGRIAAPRGQLDEQPSILQEPTVEQLTIQGFAIENAYLCAQVADVESEREVYREMALHALDLLAAVTRDRDRLRLLVGAATVARKARTNQHRARSSECRACMTPIVGARRPASFR